MRLTRLTIPASMVCALLLAACGGGGSGSSSGGGSNASVSTVSSGVITQKGSIFVNGIEYDTKSASISLDRLDQTKGDDRVLKRGMVVSVSGTANSASGRGAAASVSFRDVLEGPIQAGSIATANNSFVVLGQKIVVDDTTWIDNNGAETQGVSALNALQDNLLVEVSGFANSSGVVSATRIEVKAPGAGGCELKGTVTDTLTATSFAIGSLTINTGTLPLPAKGSAVEVHCSVAPNGDVTAIEIRAQDNSAAGVAGQHGEIEGLVSECTSGCASFKVNQEGVLVDSTTSFKHGTRDDLANGAKVEVEGGFDASGNLRAARVAFKSNNVRIEKAKIASVDGAANTIQAANLPVAIDITPLTQIGGAATPAGLSGKTVKIQGAKRSNGRIAASHIEVLPDPPAPDIGVVFRGPIDSLDAPTFVMLGLKIAITDSTEFVDVNLRTNFFSLDVNNTQIRVEFKLIGGLAIAQRISLED